MDLKAREGRRFGKIVGIGPFGAILSLILLAVFRWADARGTLPIAGDHAGVMKTIAILLIACGLGLHLWAFMTLRSWWLDNRLCANGPFRYFRHPMYAAWITFIAPGTALILNSWLYLAWAVLLHPLWHRLVKKEEKMMINTFGEVYRDYAGKTGRFFPKLLNWPSLG